ncbi:hypothetical protein [Paenibacillus tyrfis]|uniref:Uncharacterized protein n=1 Tax=Paenibacillus tyrfis TaxID=1501230 RepID=A0A081NWR3_9BACL|nr:hypothetical protein [Paenibacillus tyrfis]KEQ22886.1 hypothetical protein ET33_21315 [Paenibacillus tyrfis]
MPFNEQLPGWKATGTEPPASKKSNGFIPGEKPPADFFNWLFTRLSKVAEELQKNAAEKSETQAIRDLISKEIERLQGDMAAVRADHTKPLIIEVRTSDPVNPEIGRIWLRSDL